MQGMAWQRDAPYWQVKGVEAGHLRQVVMPRLLAYVPMGQGVQSVMLPMGYPAEPEEVQVGKKSQMKGVSEGSLV